MDKLLLDIYQSLGISETHLKENKLKFQRQPGLNSLEIVEIDFEGKPFILQSPAAKAWRAMKDIAHKDQIHLKPFSGFRSYLHQKSLIERHLKNGRAIESILTHIAIPGFSEHHSGLAVDVHAEGKNVLEEEFEQTKEFLWLNENASRFEFRLSYPKDNDQGIIYEPWHWYYTGS
ncbi:MAG: D-alanyl-D-alanine carboxypeptidase family protein [Pseudobdellovibrionaceae bacterium]